MKFINQLNIDHHKIQGVHYVKNVKTNVCSLNYLKLNSFCYSFEKAFNDYQLFVSHKSDYHQIINKLMKVGTIEQQSLIIKSELLLKDDVRFQRYTLVQKIQQILAVNELSCKLHLFGSTANQLGFIYSDINLFIELPPFGQHNYLKKLSHEEAIGYLEMIHLMFKRFFNMHIIAPIPSTRCPIIKIDFGHLLKKTNDWSNSNGLTCDFTISSSMGVFNSNLIKFFTELEPRFQLMANIITFFWAKTNGFIGCSEMSSYAFTMLIIFHCQTIQLPLLPSIESLSNSQEKLLIDDWDFSFCDEIDKIEKSKNTLSIDELVRSFFGFYSYFNFTGCVICPRTATKQLKSTFDPLIKDNKQQFVLSKFCCIQDPFELNFNLTANMRQVVFDGLINAFKRTWNYLKDDKEVIKFDVKESYFKKVKTKLKGYRRIQPKK